MSTFLIVLLSLATVGHRDGTLTGIVQDQNGNPMAGAIVDVYTAKPRVGAAVTCPSCYRDCAKSAVTDANGRFSLGELDSGLLFRVLVMAPGLRSQVTDLIDPQTTQLDVTLEPVPKNLPVDRILTGRVLDDLGEPLAGAVVSPTGAKTSEGRWWGSLPGVDEASVTNVEGRFVITTQDPKLGIDLEVTASGFADFPSKLFDLDGSEHKIRMQRGASVFGKLTFEGRGVSNRSIGIVQRNRSFQTFVGERVVVTDHTGSFQFTDLQPNQKHVIYTFGDPNQESAGEYRLGQIAPVLKTQSLETAGSGGLTQLAESKLIEGLSLTGQVTFPAGAEPPDGVKVRMSRDPAWDWCEMLVSENGEFSFTGLPPEVYSVSVNAPGFEIDPAQMQYQVTGSSTFGIRIRSDGEPVLNIKIPMQPKQ